MRLLATSDWHLDATTAGLGRLEELEVYTTIIAQAARTEQVDLVVHLGDVFDPGHLYEASYHRALFSMAAALTTSARLGSLWLAGNHDVLDATKPTSTLSPLATVAALWQPPNRNESMLTVAEVPILLLYPGVALLCLPYTSRAYMATAEYNKAWEGALVEARRARKVGNYKLVVLSHLSLPGMHPEAAGEPRGREVLFPMEEVRALQPELVLQGHYHARQSVPLGGGMVAEVVGAPLRFNFGERYDGERGYLLVDL